MSRTAGQGPAMSASAAGSGAIGSTLGAIVSVSWTPTGSVARLPPGNPLYEPIAIGLAAQATHPFAVVISNTKGWDASTGASAVGPTLAGSNPSVRVMTRVPWLSSRTGALIAQPRTGGGIASGSAGGATPNVAHRALPRGAGAAGAPGDRRGPTAVASGAG